MRISASVAFRAAASGPGLARRVRWAACSVAVKEIRPGSHPAPAAQQHATVQLLKHAACMRAHGITNFANPSGNDLGEVPPGVNPNSPRFVTATRACQKCLA